LTFGAAACIFPYVDPQWAATTGRQTVRTSLCSIAVLALVAMAASILATSLAWAQDLKPIKLPAPQMTGGMPLMDALNSRQTIRDYTAEKLSPQVLSDLLWAAFGINRPEAGKRTAPSAVNWQEIDIYVAIEEGLFLYDAKANELKPVLAQDVRGATGPQPFVAGAPLDLVYVADYTRMGKADDDTKKFYSACDTGFISQNVYLYCASAGLGTVVRGYVDKEALAKAMNLAPTQHIVLAQTVGYPEKAEAPAEKK
jgi:SagB-type dehydrogenase family enzyme